LNISISLFIRNVANKLKKQDARNANMFKYKTLQECITVSGLNNVRLQKSILRIYELVKFGETFYINLYSPTSGSKEKHTNI